ncbi:MAG: response regulator [Desulfobacterales bacterium]|nr:response regulator [Desulfobacterales bacterium]
MKVEFENVNLPPEKILPILDVLTGLCLHSAFQFSLKMEIEAYRKEGKPCTIALIDMDWFSRFNQKMGFQNGDRALKHTADIILHNIREQDLAVRFTEDEFALIFPNTGIECAYDLVDRIRCDVENDFEGLLTVSAALTSCSKKCAIREILIENAKDALRIAKLEGKDKIIVHNDESINVITNSYKPTVMIVDDSELNLKIIEAILKPMNYHILKVTNGKEALHYAKQNDIDLILLDVMMPGMDGYEVCRQLKSNRSTMMMPVILITNLNDKQSKINGIEAGADDFITKPPNRIELITRIKSLIKLKSVYKDFTDIESVLFLVAKAIEAKNCYTKGHSDRVSSLAVSIGKRMKLGEEEIEALRFGGLLHDIGKIGISNRILNKSESLTLEEWSKIKAHPETGYWICYPLKKRLKNAMHIIRHHHEKLDGSGYPDGLKGDDISIVVKIIAIADIYDALITDRPYRKAFPLLKTLQILQEEAMNGKLDKQVVNQLVSSMNEHISIKKDPVFSRINTLSELPYASPAMFQAIHA